MCILLKLHYAKFDVSRLFCRKVIEEKPSGEGRLLGKGRVKYYVVELSLPAQRNTQILKVGIL